MHHRHPGGVGIAAHAQGHVCGAAGRVVGHPGRQYALAARPFQVLRRDAVAERLRAGRHYLTVSRKARTRSVSSVAAGSS
jgi:hypothetical protein